MPAVDIPTMSGSASTLLKRQYGFGGYGDGYYGNNRWNNWGRWVLLGAIIVAFIIIFGLCSCLTARRRRKRGAQPYYGTGWMANHGAVNYYGGNNQNRPQQEQGTYGNQGYYGGYDNNNNTAPPAYAGGQNSGYYGQQNGVEMQPPSNTYQPQRGGDNVYEPPTGPPPNKEIIR